MSSCSTLASRTLRSYLRATLGVAAVMLLADASWAGPDTALAEALFQEAKLLMNAGKYSQACPKFAESQRLDPGSGTLLALAICHEGEGRTATAWSEYRDVQSLARRDRRADRERAAATRAAALERRLVRIVVRLAPETLLLQGLELRHNGSTFPQAAWETSFPVDPGDHVFEAKALSKRPWSTTVQAVAEGKTYEVLVPSLVSETKPLSSSAPATGPARTSPSGSSQNSFKSAGWIVGGVGLAAVGVGAFFGLKAQSRQEDAESLCPKSPCSNPQAITTNDEAGRAADISTVAFGVGAVGLTLGAILLLTSSPAARSSSPGTPQVGLSGTTLLVSAPW